MILELHLIQNFAPSNLTEATRVHRKTAHSAVFVGREFRANVLNERCVNISKIIFRHRKISPKDQLD